MDFLRFKGPNICIGHKDREKEKIELYTKKNSRKKFWWW